MWLPFHVCCVLIIPSPSAVYLAAPPGTDCRRRSHERCQEISVLVILSLPKPAPPPPLHSSIHMRHRVECAPHGRIEHGNDVPSAPLHRMRSSEFVSPSPAIRV